MSDGAAPRIDPRFDPRFQRGYVPDAATPPSPESQQQHEPERVAPNAEASATAAPRPDGSAGRRAAGDARHPAPGAPAASGPARHPSIEEANEADPVLAVLLDKPPQGESSRFAPWFMAGWAVAVIATIVGAGLWWASVSSENYYGPVSQSERWLQMVGWTVAPSLIQAGLLGCVAMLVWTGVRHAARREERQ